MNEHELWHGPIETNMNENEKIEKDIENENKPIVIESFMTENGKIIKENEYVHTLKISMEIFFTT